jgi:hypothetical protein
LTKERQLFDKKIIYPLILFNLAALLSVFVSDVPTISLRESVQFVFYSIVFYVIVQQVRSKEMIIKIAKCLLISSSIFILFGLIQVVKKEFPVPNIHIAAHKGMKIFLEKSTAKEIRIESQDIDISRSSSFFFTSVATGSFLNQVILLLLPILLGNNLSRKKKIPMFLLLIGGITLWIATYSRAAWVILILCLQVMVLLRKRKKEILTVTIITLVVIIAAASNQGVRYRFIEIFSTKQKSNVAHFRLWKEAAINIARNPLLGTGAGSLTAPIRTKSEDTNSKNYSGRWVHNMFLQVSAEIGIFGGMAIFLFFLAILSQYWRAMKMKENSLFYDVLQGFVVGVFSCLLINLTLNVFYKIIFWVSLAVSYSATNVFFSEENDTRYSIKKSY